MPEVPHPSFMVLKSPPLQRCGSCFHVCLDTHVLGSGSFEALLKLLWQSDSKDLLSKLWQKTKGMGIWGEGGLRDDGVAAGGGLVFGGPDTYGLPPRKAPGSILRKQVRYRRWF